MRRFRPYLRYLRSVRGYFIAATLCAAVYGFVYGFVLNYVLMQKVFPALFKSGGPPLDDWKLWGYAALVPAVFLVRGLAGYFNAYFVSLCGVKSWNRSGSISSASSRNYPSVFTPGTRPAT